MVRVVKSAPVDDIEQSGTPSVSVAMCTYNGAAYLSDQLDSIRNQTLRPTQILISDDGSSDASAQISKDFQHETPEINVVLFAGRRLGFASNFLDVMRRVPEETDFTALSDQDDIWFADKLERAIAALKKAGASPALYGAATLQCRDNLEPMGVSRLPTVELGFLHSLGQNYAGGNTMVFNNAALRVIQNALSRDFEIQVHDWWLYQIVSGAGGKIIFDQEPCMYYRQHASNQIGQADSLNAKLNRLKRMCRGDYRQWNSKNIEALDLNRHILTPDNLAVLEALSVQRNGTLLDRLKIMKNPGVYRQGLLGQIGLFAALALNRY